MPDYDDDGNEITETPPRSGKSLRDELEETRRRNTELEAVAADTSGEDAKRELAFIKADLQGANPKLLDFFRQNYHGDYTADAIRAAAQDAGVLPDVTEQANQAIQGQAQMANAASGSYAPGIPGDETEMWAAFEKAVSSGAPDAMQQGAMVLRRYGREAGLEGAGAVEMTRGGTQPQPLPINAPGYRGTPPT